MTKNSQVPAIRFKGFTEAWEQYKLETLFEKGGSGGTPLSTNEKYYNGNIPFLSISDISKSNGFIYETEKSITDEGLKNSAAWIVPRESISLAMYASVGKVAILKKDVATSQAFYNMVFSNLSVRNVIFQRLKMMELNEEWNRLISTGTQANLNAKKVKDLKFTIPKDMDEQNKIGDLFSNIDSLITLHQRKYDKLVNVKKALLGRMFPTDGEATPRIRFKGFTEAWEQCKVGELGSIVTGNTPPTAITDYYSDDGLIWVTPTDINQNITTSTARRLSEKGESIARVVPPKTILVTCIASIGKNTLLGSKGSFNQQINALVPAPKNDPYFLFTQSYHWSSHMKRLGGALTFQIVNKKEFSEIDTLVPQPDEQKKIGSLFNQIDSLITLHQRKYEKLVNIKKALLQKMFV